MTGYFVTGTDTGIGKTIVSTILAVGLEARYWKPIQTGALEGTDSEFVAKWIGEKKVWPEVYKFPDPLSPHLAAAAKSCEIDLNRCLASSRNLAGTVIVEGAGGVLVPINSSYLIIDLIKELKLPVVVVTSTRLGTINHTLLTLEALKNKNIQVAGVITTGDQIEATHKSIEKYGQVQILGHILFASSFSLTWFHRSFKNLSISNLENGDKTWVTG